ncbi:assimilatory sulfite reductase (NADPH) hemoprotein subunit [Psychrosphaera ytuae]|uniref:Sulfite reductase [NADPH] hemoprotein beta-component n=1 Tax=Psychrosphaera ytuae TaxID=2820710 RepID=A0A975HHI0_9GAMM|nr:assimilatory sulfite reductase (NADPH) hemoprotein subunit [Psychrosphaera ytuae]QTH63073.1 assimilatory sulfite reductase (NADPH) hemoprotein subunit [Psychrosphaera ytuae]
MSQDNPKKLAVNEGIKTKSNYLRGTISEGLQDKITGALAEDDTQLTKFHGFYQQDDRDVRDERREQKLEPLYSFMLRARVPGGVATAEQWLAIDKMAEQYTLYGSLRLTTRQTFQYHGMLKPNIKNVISGLNDIGLDSLAACGDVNRNILCNTNPVESYIHQEVYETAKAISEHLLPKTRAYAEIWLDGEKLDIGEEEQEPIYGPTYLPRKFKAAVAIPPHNDVDVYTNDLGLIAIVEGEGKDAKLLGFNVVVGGGMGSTHGDVTTYPRLATDLGFVSKEDAILVSEGVVKAQRDLGNRESRKHARLKYTIDTVGIDAFRDAVVAHTGVALSEPKPVTFDLQGDRLGWTKGVDNNWHLTLFIENGRIIDTDERQLKTGLREIAKVHKGDFRMTANQNIIIANVPEDEKVMIEGLTKQYGLHRTLDEGGVSPIRGNSMACVALPTCALAMAESERYLPELIDKLDELAIKHGIAEQDIVLRMTGCPNGCARPFAAEIAFVGKGPGKYNFYLGADGLGTRLNKMYRENIGEAEILAELDSLFGRYASEREQGERFGDFVVRAGIIKATVEGKDFHAA